VRPGTTLANRTFQTSYCLLGWHAPDAYRVRIKFTIYLLHAYSYTENYLYRKVHKSVACPSHFNIQSVPECVDLAPKLIGTLYFKYLENIF
jgi:hypothetical protein